MDDIKLKGPDRSRTARRWRQDVAKTAPSYKSHKFLGRVAAAGRQTRYRKFLRSSFVRQLTASRFNRAYALMVAFLFVISIGVEVMQPFLEKKDYSINQQSRAVMPRPNAKFGDLLKPDYKDQVYAYNQGYTGGTEENGLDATGVPRFGAKFSMDPAKGVTVTDTANQVDLTMKPKFRLGKAQKEDNQMIYKLAGHNGYLVYTARISGVKEDIVLQQYGKDKIEFEFELEMNSGLEARLEKNGSIGVYGSDAPVSGKVSTGSENDAKLLEKLRQNSPKNKFLFNIPAPVVVETNKTVSSVKTHFELTEGKKIKLIATDLKTASYPLSIDPSIYVETAQKLMRGNNETNLDFDVENELIQKGKLTGARFNSWTGSLALPANRQAHATATYGGYVYAVGGNGGSGATSTVYWAKFNTTTGAIEAPNPGDGACASWCTNTAYDLPAAREAHSMVAYNGYLYVMGGKSGTTHYNTTYIAKLGLNGEPSRWHPTDTNPANWVSWYPSATNLPANRAYTGAVAYNNKMYLLAGQEVNNTAPVATAHAADINPNGTLSSWSTTGMINLPANRMGHSIQVYNDRLYVIGGASTTSAVNNTVYYMKLNSDGTMAGTAWATTTAFTTARTAWGGNFSTIWGGYMYIYGGCKVIASSNCSTTADLMNDVQIASINGDGTVSDWRAINGLTSTARAGLGFVGWRGTLYGIGGCTAITTGSCSTTIAATNYGAINQDGEASSVRDSYDHTPETGTCSSGGGYIDCDLPDEGTTSLKGGRMSGGVVVNNGFIYYIGGCTAVGTGGGGNVCYAGGAGKTSDHISYASVRSDGVIVRVAATACDAAGENFVGSWCVESGTGKLSGLATPGLAAFGATVFNNTIYLVGGTTGTQWQDQIYRNTPLADGSFNADWSAQSFLAVGITGDEVNGTTARGYSYVFTRANPSAASTNPGNLYVIGGCTGPSGAGEEGLNCQGTPNPVFNSVWKCNIATALSINGCTRSGQLTIDAESVAGDQGLGVMAGALYANYVYLVGGQSTYVNDSGKVIYAKIDNSNNIVAASGSTWVISPNEISPARRRGAAFGYNGYLYAMAGYADGSALNDLLFAKINTSDGSIGAFVTSSVTVTQRWDLRVMVNNGYVYVVGGCSTGAPPSSCTAMTGNVQVFQLFNNYSGAPKLYEYQDTAGYPGGQNSAFADNRLGHASAIVNGYLYVAGGCTGTGDCTVTSDKVSYAKINAFGYLGAWTNSGIFDGWRLPSSRGWTQLEAAGGSLYIIGGQNTTNTLATVSYTAPNASTGAITGWTSTTALPEARSKFGATVWNNRIYVVGGNSTMADSSAKATVYISNDLSGGGAVTSWTTNSTNFNIARSGATAITYANNIYVLGGATSTSVITGDVQYGKIGSDGTITGWSYTSSLPDKLYGADGFAVNGFMYLFGGKASSEVCETNTIAASISANTVILPDGAGNNPTGIGEWFETNEKYIGSRYGASSAYYEGKLFLTGGACNSTLTYVPTANKVAQTTLLTQPQVAKYSRMIDTDTDVTPKDWLLNGLDNSTGAEWYLRYRSMHDLDTLVNPAEDCGTSATMPQMTTWGQETNFGIVSLGKVENYTPKNSTGGNINCARYYYFNLYIDSQQAYGYPEDVTRGPTIADLTLFFTADPSKRLRHGKTFTGGEQQPLDTPCKDADPGADPNDDNCDNL